MGKSDLWNPQKVMVGSFLLCFFVAGIPVWLIPYSSLNVPDAFYGLGVVTVFFMALILSFRFGIRKGLVVPGLVFPAVLMIRVVVEGIMDPGRHNLWPLALVIVAVLGFAVAGAGAALGWLGARIFRMPR